MEDDRDKSQKSKDEKIVVRDRLGDVVMASYNEQENPLQGSITFKDIDAKINSVTPGEIFWQYVKSGFLYANKKKKMNPYLEQVEDNWTRAMSLGEEIFWVATVADKETKSWASVCNWRTTLTGWVSQHLVSSGHAALPLMLMLATQRKVIEEASSKPYESFQNWYRPTNKYANKVFGSLAKTIEPGARDQIEYRYYTIPKKALPSMSVDGDQVWTVKRGNADKELGKMFRDVFTIEHIKAEELDVDDIELHELDETYRKVGLSRRREFWVCSDEKKKLSLGFAIVYRAPIGLNFSMLENRVELHLVSGVSDFQAREACVSMLKSVQQSYSDFDVAFIPVVARGIAAIALESLGVSFLRTYNQFIWLKNGYESWYNVLAAISNNSINRWRNNAKHKMNGL